METKKKKRAGQQGELMRALDITPDDLIANDNGTISPEQVDSVIKRQNYQLKTPQILASVFALFGVMLPIIILIAESSEGSPVPIMGLIAVASIFFGIAAIPAAFALWQRQYLKNELLHNEVMTTQGVAVVNMGENTSLLEINGLKLKAPPDVLRRIKHLDHYIVHYLPKTNVILSMEYIDDDDNIRDDIAINRLEDANDDEMHIIDEAPQSQADAS